MRRAALALALLAACGDDATPADAAAADAAVVDAVPWDAPPHPAHCPLDAPAPAFAAVDSAAGRMTLACGDFELVVSGLADGVARLSYGAPGAGPPPRSWAVAAPPAAATIVAGGHGAAALLCTEALAVEVDADCHVVVSDAAGTIIVEDQNGYASGYALDSGELVPTASLSRATPPGERFYGLGEKTGRMDRRGRRYLLWNTDAYSTAHGGFAPDADPLYQSIPFLIGLRGGVAYGLFTDDPHRQGVDLAAAADDRYTITSIGGRIDQYVIAGPALADVVRRYTALTGRLSLPPRWALGYHQCRWGYTPDDRLLELAAEFRARDIPADGLWLDIQHHEGFRTFTWDPVAFPDPAGLTAALDAASFKLTVIADPGIKADPAWGVYSGGLGAGVFLRTAAGGTYLGPVWAGDSAFPDFTLAAARSWWGDHIGGLSDLGVRGIWLDVNEPTVLAESGGGNTIPNSVVADGEGTPTTLAEIHNVYALRQAQATWEGLRAAAPTRRPFILVRAAYAGIQRWAAAWTGDAPSNWPTLDMTLAMLLGMGLSGEPFVGSDVGGYSGNATPELFARWIELGAVSPFFRAHVTIGVPGQEPWAFGEEVEDISREHITRRYELLPTIYGLFAEAAATGAPVLRPLVWEFQDDPATWSLDDEALLGRWLLVAPVVAAGATTRSVYLPAGRWFERFSGAVVEGPTTVEVPVTLAATPSYVREGGLLFVGPPMEWTDALPLDPLTLEAYPGPTPTEHLLYEDAGDGFAHAESDCYSRTRYTLERTTSGARLAVAAREGACPPAARHVEVRLRRVDHAPSGATLGGAALTPRAGLDELRAAGEGWFWDQADLAVVVRFPDQAGVELVVSYDPGLSSPEPWVEVPIKVHVPAGTPTTPPVSVASSADAWAVHHPLAWSSTEPDTAVGTLLVPRGQWFWFKYTRGDWATVEKWPGCVEATNRYAFGAAHPGRDDVVWAFAGSCP